MWVMISKILRHIARPWLICLMLLCNRAAWCEDHQEIVLFPDITLSHRSGLVDDGDLQRDQVDGSLDLLVTGNHGNLQFLGELHVDSHEKELSRLHAGWRFANDATLSFGRFHNLQGYWNTQFHHGAFLQSSISPPGIIEDDGPLPTHYVGMEVNGEIALAESGSLGYSFGVGKSAVWDNNKLESPDIIGPDHGGKHTAAARLTYSPFEGDPTQMGIFMAESRIPVENSALTEIKQTVGGAFGNWEHGDWRVIGELYLFHNHLIDPSSTRNSTLQYGYVQGEYALSEKMRLFGRTENSSGSNALLTLQEFPEFAKKRNMLGLHYDLTHNQALKVEMGRLWRLDNTFNQLQIQWSAAFK